LTRIEQENGIQIDNRLYMYLVSLQVNPRLDLVLRKSTWSAANGQLRITTGKLLPIAYPTALGSGGLILRDPKETPLMRAAQAGSADLVNQLLAQGADVNAKDQRGQTALFVACLHGRATHGLVRALLTAAADINAKDSLGRTPLLVAIQSEQDVPGLPIGDGAAVVKELLSANADVNTRDAEGVTPLIAAAKYADVEIVYALLKSNADASARDASGETALSAAVQANRPDVVKALGEKERVLRPQIPDRRRTQGNLRGSLQPNAPDLRP
jgi:ankyrin repeat protein